MSVDAFALSDGFAEFAALGMYEVTVVSDAVVVSDSPGGEIRFFIREREPGIYLLSRAARGDEECVILWSPDPVDAERYLTLQVGAAAREQSRLDRVKSPTRAEQIADQFEVDEVGPEVVALRPAGRDHLPARFPKMTVGVPIFAFAGAADHEVQVLRARYLNPKGTQ